MSEGKFENLPIWAQNKIRRLERDIEHWRTHLQAGPEDSRVFANPYSEMARKPLGDADVQFCRTEDDPTNRTSGFKVGIRGDYLEVYGGDTLQIQPHSSNVIEVRLGRF